MNRLYKNLLGGLLLLPLLFASCQGDKLKDTTRKDERAGVVRFTLSNSLRATGDENSIRPTPAFDREKTISKLYAVVYYKDSRHHHYKTIECASIPENSATWEFDNKKSGSFIFFLVANPDDALAEALKKGPLTPNDLGNLIATQSPGEDNTATNFLMTSDLVEVAVDPKTTTSLPNKITLERVAARFDFYNKIDGLEIESITFGKRYTSSHLFAQVGKTDELTYTENEKVYLWQPSSENEAIRGTVYGYETDKRGETFFTLKAKYNGSPLSPETISLDNIVVKRNHLYNIILHELNGEVSHGDEPFGKLKYEIKVKDWEEGEAITVDEDKVLQPLYVGWAAKVANASYLTPYLKNSPKEIFTTTKDATEIDLCVFTYAYQGRLELDAVIDGVTLDEIGYAYEDPKTGMLTQHYTLQLPERDEYAPLTWNENNLSAPDFLEIKLVAKNGSGQTTKTFVVKHGSIKMPLEYLSQSPLSYNNETYECFFAPKANKITDVSWISGSSVEDLNILANIPNHEIQIEGGYWHIPRDVAELNSLIPRKVDGSYIPVGESQSVGNIDNQWEYVLFPCWQIGNGVTVATDVRTDFAKKKSFALRFKNLFEAGEGMDKQMLQMAYRYEWVGDFAHVHYSINEVESSGVAPEVESYFKITSRYLGPNFNGRVEDIMTDEFWEKDSQNDISRTIYALGKKQKYTSQQGTLEQDIDHGMKAYILCYYLKDLGSYSSDEYEICAALLSKPMWYSNHIEVVNSHNSSSNDVPSFPIWYFSDK